MLFCLSTDLHAQLPYQFTNTAHIDNGSEGFGVVVGSDGTVLLANYEDGLRAYTYNGTTFINTAHIDDGGLARNVAIDSR